MTPSQFEHANIGIRTILGETSDKPSNELLGRKNIITIYSPKQDKDYNFELFAEEIKFTNFGLGGYYFRLKVISQEKLGSLQSSKQLSAIFEYNYYIRKFVRNTNITPEGRRRISVKSKESDTNSVYETTDKVFILTHNF